MSKQEQIPTFNWPSQNEENNQPSQETVVTTIKNIVNSFAQNQTDTDLHPTIVTEMQANNESNQSFTEKLFEGMHHAINNITTISSLDSARTEPVTNEHSTSDPLLAAITTDDRASTYSITENLTTLVVDNVSSTFSDISSTITSSAESITDSILSTQSIDTTESVRDLFSSISSNVSAITTTETFGLLEDVASNNTISVNNFTETLLSNATVQEASTTISTILETINSNISEIFATESVPTSTSQRFDEEILSTENIDKTTTTISNMLQTFTNEISHNTDSTQNENDATTMFTTINDILDNVTSKISNNVSSLYPTERISISDNDKVTREETDQDVLIYIIVGLVLAILIIFSIGLYVFCKKCEKTHKKCGDYYVTQLKECNSSDVKSNSNADESNCSV